MMSCTLEFRYTELSQIKVERHRVFMVFRAENVIFIKVGDSLMINENA